MADKKKKVFTMYADIDWMRFLKKYCFRIRTDGEETIVNFTKCPSDKKVRVTIEEI